MLDVILFILFFVWPFAWMYILFAQGYARIAYPGGEKGVNPFNESQMAKVRNKGWLWLLISAAALLLWLVLPVLFLPQQSYIEKMEVLLNTTSDARKTRSGANYKVTYEPYVRQVTVKMWSSDNALWKMMTIADFIEIFNYLKTIFSWLTEDQVYHQVPPRGVESFGLTPNLVIIIPEDQEEPVDLPRD